MESTTSKTAAEPAAGTSSGTISKLNEEVKYGKFVNIKGIDRPVLKLKLADMIKYEIEGKGLLVKSKFKLKRKYQPLVEREWEKWRKARRKTAATTTDQATLA